MPEHTPAPTPARSLYGFFLYLFSKVLLGVYCIWAFTPDSWLHYINIHYYPQKYWATAIPIQCLVALTIFVFFIYPSLNLILTANIDDVNTVSDPHAHYPCKMNESNINTSGHCICKDSNICMKYTYTTSHEEVQENTVPPLHDLNIRFVCRRLYLNDNNVQY